MGLEQPTEVKRLAAQCLALIPRAVRAVSQTSVILYDDRVVAIGLIMDIKEASALELVWPTVQDRLRAKLRREAAIKIVRRGIFLVVARQPSFVAGDAAKNPIDTKHPILT